MGRWSRHPELPSRRLLIAVAAGILCSCSSTPKHTALPTPTAVKALQPIPTPAVGESKPKDFPGLPNVVTYHDGFICGGVPEGDAGFDTLAAMGIKTIISVDGSAPEPERAAARGIRYIHLPIGYNGFDERRKLELVRATRDAMADGPVYIHCHHGKHRSAGAAATIAESLGWMTPQQGVALMKVSGAAPNYTGLYACATSATVLAAADIDAIPADFPAVSKPSGYVQAMVEIDDALDHLKAIEKAGWGVPADDPDLVPAAEAGRLADLFRAAQNTPYAKRKPADFAGMMMTAHSNSQALEDLLAGGERDGSKLSAQLKLVAASCKDCHAKYRD